MKIGDVILQEEPYCMVLSQKHKGKRCDRCFNISNTLKKCGGCGQLQYCDKVCQKRDWAVHKSECKCLKAVLPKIPTDSVRMMFRLICSMQHNLPMNSQWSRTLDDFMTHKSDIQKDSVRTEQFAQVAFTLKELAGDRLTLPSAEDIFILFCKMMVNSFTICDGELQGIGTGLYLSGSLLDHSCRPNAVASFHGNTLVVRATKDIPDPSPNKVFISYIDQLATTSERQKQLMDQYYFHCQCVRCQDTASDDLMTSFCCPKSNCSGAVGLSKDEKFQACNQCGESEFSKVLKEGAMAVLEECKQQLVKIDETKKKEDHKAIFKLSQDVLLKTDKVLHPMNIYLVRILDWAFDAAIEIEEFNKALKYGLRTLDAYRQYYTDEGPNYAIQLFKIGKLQLYLRLTEKAHRSLQQAESILSVTHGTDHPIYRDITLFICQCAEELRISLDKSDE